MPRNAFIDREVAFRMNIGVNSYDPAFTSESLQLQVLKNLEPRYNRLVASTKHERMQIVHGDRCGPWEVVSFADYVDSTLPSVQIYGLTVFEPFQYEPALDGKGRFIRVISTVDNEIYEFPFPNKDPFAFVPFGEGVFVSRHGENIAFIRDNEYTPNVTNFVSDVQPRYMVAGSRHLVGANIIENGSLCVLRVRWSDLEQPTNWEVLASNEADFFDLDAADGFITGLSRQRGFIYVYANSAIWVGRYTPGRTVAGIIAPYLFEQLYTGIGCVYHYSQVQVKEIDYFIGSDNIYSLSGHQLIPIGDPIWNFFQDTQDDLGFNQKVFAHTDEQNNQIYWQYKTNVEGLEWLQIIYNYAEKKWSVRDNQNAFAAWLPRLKPRLDIPIDSWDCPSYPTVNEFDAVPIESRKDVSLSVLPNGAALADFTPEIHNAAIGQKIVISESADQSNIETKVAIIFDVLNPNVVTFASDTNTTVSSFTGKAAITGEVETLSFQTATMGHSINDATILLKTVGHNIKLGQPITFKFSTKPLLLQNTTIVSKIVDQDNFRVYAEDKTIGAIATSDSLDWAIIRDNSELLSVEDTFIEGEWQFRVPPFTGLYGNHAVPSPGNLNPEFDAQFYIRTDKNEFFDETPMPCLLETFEFDWRTLFQNQEINRLKFQYRETNKKDPGDKTLRVNVKLKILTRDNPAVPFRESDTVNMNQQLVNERIWHFRNVFTPGLGKFIKFRIEWDNEVDLFIDEVYALSLILKVPQPDIDPDR